MQPSVEEAFDDVQDLFRQVNERVLEANRVLGPTAILADFVCECRDPTCADRLTLSVAQFASIRRHPHRLVVRTGHDDPADQRIVEAHGEFVVVERQGGLALAEPQTAA